MNTNPRLYISASVASYVCSRLHHTWQRNKAGNVRAKFSSSSFSNGICYRHLNLWLSRRTGSKEWISGECIKDRNGSKSKIAWGSDPASCSRWVDPCSPMWSLPGVLKGTMKPNPLMSWVMLTFNFLIEPTPPLEKHSNENFNHIQFP